jgi:nuclear transport factor 2 (NTF2) superfamily protein
MTETEAIELARAYVALCNAHRVELIRPLFAADAVYRSGFVGDYRGAAAISAMMRTFFARYPDAFWLCENFRFSNNRVSFEFSLQASDASTGEHLQRSGIEGIDYGADGLISKLEVKAD